MGKFIDTSYTEAINNVTGTITSLLNNPYYMWNDKKPTMVTYYHINAEQSSLDESSGMNYSDLGPNCPFRYNEIENFVLYGIDKIALQLQAGEFGLESDEITGDAIVLPGTIVPYPSDYFIINHANDSWLFRVNDVNKDTLYDGSNIWKLSYRLEHIDDSHLQDLVVEDYKMIVNNVGTKYTPILRSSSYDLVDSLDHICTTLKQYFVSLYYNERVQTFIFTHYLEDHFYDPYMIEFIIRNKILENGSHDEYIYVEHKIATIKTFALDYNRTFFKAVEDKDIKAIQKAKTDSTADYIDEFGSIFAARTDPYFKMNYYVPTMDPTPQPYVFHNVIECFPKELIPKIVNNDLYTKAEINQKPEFGLRNIIIKHFNKTAFDQSDFDNLEKYDFSDSKDSFYMIPMIIYAFESFEQGLLVKEPYENIIINQ